MRKLIAAAVLAAGLFASTAALAVTNISGSLVFAGATNWYDSSNGLVPSGFGNSGNNGANVPIGAGVEFGFNDGANLDTANFTDTSLVLSDASASSGGASGFTQTFTASTAGFFNGIALGSNTFGGLTFGVVADTLTVHWNGGEGITTRTANFTFGNSVPEPATWAMMILGMAMVGVGLRRRKAALASA